MVVVTVVRRFGGSNGGRRCWWLGYCGAGRRSVQRCYCSLRWAIMIVEEGASVREGLQAGVFGILAGEGNCGRGGERERKGGKN